MIHHMVQFSKFPKPFAFPGLKIPIFIYHWLFQFFVFFHIYESCSSLQVSFYFLLKFPHKTVFITLSEFQAFWFELLVWSQLEWMAMNGNWCSTALQHLCVRGGNKVWQVNRGHFLKEDNSRGISTYIHAHKHKHKLGLHRWFMQGVGFAGVCVWRGSWWITIERTLQQVTAGCIFVVGLHVCWLHCKKKKSRKSSLCHQSLHKKNCTSLLLLTVHCL